MNSKNYNTRITDYQDEVQAHKNSLTRWQDGKFKPSEKAAGKMLFNPSKRMLRAQAIREAAWDEMLSYG